MVLPNFLICGAPKAGTTSLYHYLDQHPDVYMSDEKETYFFCRDANYDRGAEWFSENYFSEYKGERAIGEASVRNMTYRGAAKNIAQLIPQAKLIFILRNPVDRLYSHYNYEVRQGLVNPLRSFSVKIRDEDSNWRKGMLDKGMYFKHIMRYERHFKHEQIYPILFEEFISNTHVIVKDIFKFIGVDSEFGISVSKRHNASRYPDNFMAYQLVYGVIYSVGKILGSRFFPHVRKATKPLREWFFRNGNRKPSDMAPEDRAYLQEIYREPNARLAEYLGRDLSHWT